MPGDKKWFSSLTPVKEKMYITYGDNGRGRVISEGVVHVSDKVTLKRVTLVKSLGFNLLSVSQLLDDGFEVRFKSGESHLLDSQGDLVCMIIPEGQIFRADFSRSLGPARCLMAVPTCDLWKWHRRLGHLSFDLVSRLSGLDFVRGLPRLKFEKDLVCAPCRHGHSPSTPDRCHDRASDRVVAYGPCWASSSSLGGLEVVCPSCDGRLLSLCLGVFLGGQK
jgi:hypothetical protein